MNAKEPAAAAGWVAYDVHPPPLRYHKVIVLSPTPFPSEAVYPTVKLHVFVYTGRRATEDVGGSKSTIVKVSVWDVAMSTWRGFEPKL